MEVQHHPDNRTNDSTYHPRQEGLVFIRKPLKKRLSQVYLVIPESIGIHVMAHHVGDSPVSRG